MKKLLSVAFITALFIAGCGDNSTTEGGGGQPQTEPKKVTIDAEEFIVVSGTATKGSNGVGGDATLVAPKPYTYGHGIQYTIKLSLDDNGAFTVLTNGGVGFQRAVTIAIARQGDKFSQADIVSGGGKKESFLDALNAEGIDVTKDFEIVIEIHNHSGVTGVHFHVIKAGAKKEVVDVDFEEGKVGENWGLRLQGAYVKSMATEESHH